MTNRWFSPVFNFKLGTPSSHQLVISWGKNNLKVDWISAYHFIQISHLRSGKVIKSSGQDSSLAELILFVEKESTLFISDITTRSPSLHSSCGILHMRKF